jgi:hypothetical protein
LAIVIALPHKQNSKHSPATPGILRLGCRHLCTLCTWIWGPSCSIWLCYTPMATMPGILAQWRGWWEAAGCSWMTMTLVLWQWVQLAVVMAWQLWSWFADGPEIMWFKLCNLLLFA